MARVVEGPEALALLGAAFGGEACGALAGRPLVAVALDAPIPDGLSDAAARVPCVVVGVHRDGPLPLVTSPLDVVLTTRPDPPAPWVGCPVGVEEPLEALAASIEHAPLATVTLVQLLRMSGALSVADGLLAESLAYGVLQGGPEHRAWLTRRSLWQRPPVLEPPVLLDRVGASLTITLNRPRLRNAFDRTMRDQLVEALQLVAADSSVERVELRGNGSSFCIGGDLREFGTVPDPATAHVVRSTRSPAAWMAACADRVTVHLHGQCIGAGIELAAFARAVVAAPDTVVRLPELSMGLVPGAGGTVSIPRRIGRARAGYLMLSGTALDAVTASAWGLIDQLEPA